MSSLNAYDKSSPRSSTQSMMNLVPYFQSLWSTSPSLPNEYKDRDHITWGGFDYVEHHKSRHLCLMLAYHNGFQIWNLEGPTFEELMSIKKEGPIKCLKFISEAGSSKGSTTDVLREHRPVVAVVSGEDDPKFPRSSIKLYSLISQDYLKMLRFKSDVYNVASCPHVFVVVLKEELYGFDPRTLEKVFVVSTYASPSSFGVFSVSGGRWLAYPATVPPPSNGNSPNSSPSSSFSTSPNLLGVAKDVASTTFSGLFYLGEAGRKKMSNYLYQNDSPENPEKEAAGTVAVYDVVDKSLISHFRAHFQPLHLLQFDPSGTLLVTVSVDGHNFHVFQICPSPGNPTKSYLHLYKLARGYTDATIQSVSFNSNSHWLAAQSSRGTVHLFALRLGGGNVSRHSHVEQKKENQDIYQFQHFTKTQTESSSYIRLTARNRIKQASSAEDSQQSVGVGCTTFANKGKETVVYTLSQQGKLLQTQLIPHASYVSDGDPNELLLKLKQIGEILLARKSGSSEIVRSPSTLSWNKPKNGSFDESKWIPNVELSSTNYFKPLWRNPNFSIKAFEFKDPNKKYLFDSELLSDNTLVTKIYEPVHHRNSLSLNREDIQTSSPSHGVSMSMSVPVYVGTGYISQSLPNSCPWPSPDSSVFSGSLVEGQSVSDTPSSASPSASLSSSDAEALSPSLIHSNRKEISHYKHVDNDGEVFTFSPEDPQLVLEDQDYPIVYAQFRVEEDEEEP